MPDKPSMDRRGGHEVPCLALELPEIDSFLEMKSHFYLSIAHGKSTMQQLGGHIAKTIQIVQTGLMSLTKQKEYTSWVDR